MALKEPMINIIMIIIMKEILCLNNSLILLKNNFHLPHGFTSKISIVHGDLLLDLQMILTKAFQIIEVLYLLFVCMLINTWPSLLRIMIVLITNIIQILHI